MSDNPYKLAAYDTSIPDHYALKKVRRTALDLCISLTGAYTANGFGLSHEVVSPEDHDNILGVVAARIPNPGPFVAGDAASIKNQERTMGMYDAQEKFAPIVRAAVVAVLPERLLRLAEIDGSLRHLARTYKILDDIEGKLPFTEADAIQCRERVSSAYTRGASIRPFVADQLAHLKYLTDEGQGVSNMDALRLMKAAFTSTKVDQGDFAPAFSEFLQVHGALGDQSPENWAAFIVSFVEERLTHHAEANAARRRGQAFAAAIGGPEHAMDAEDAAAYEKEHAKDYAAFVAFKNAAKAKANPPTSNWVAPSGPPRPNDPLYCWSHGCIGHASGGDTKKCLNPKPGHKFDAVYRNQMGGKKAK
jgi:hypothetical protein